MGNFDTWGKSLVQRVSRGGFGDKLHRRASSVGFYALRSRIFQKLGVDLLIDVGANAGQYVRDVRPGFSGPIISFEPTVKAFQSLSRRAQGDPLWKCQNLALGAETGSATIQVSSNDVFSSFLPISAYGRKLFDKETLTQRTETVRVERLDQVLPVMFPEWRTSRIYLKVDTQGSDIHVIRGASGILSQVVALQMEISLLPIYQDQPHWTTTVQEIEQMGFAVSGTFPVNFDGNAAVELDCVMVRRDSPKER